MLTLYLLILFGFIFSRGFFTLPSIFILSFVFILITLRLLTHRFNPKGDLTPPQLLIIVTLLTTILYGGLYQYPGLFISLSYGLLALSIVLVYMLTISNKSREKKLIFYSLLLTAFALRLLMIKSSPSPSIDVFYDLKLGALNFLSGENPYSNIHTIPYKDIFLNNYSYFYPYFPTTLIATLPFVKWLGDPRYLFLFSEMTAAILIYKLGFRGKHNYYYSLIFLFNPISLFMLEQSYTEPFILFLFTLLGWLLSKKNLRAYIVLGLLLASKQYNILLIPLFIRKIGRKHFTYILYAILVSLVIIAPFFLWDPRGFIHDAILVQPNLLPRYEGLTIFSLSHLVGVDYNSILSYLIIIPFSLMIYFSKKITTSRFFFLSSLLFFGFFLFNKWAFGNYYYLIAQLFLLGIIYEKS